MCPSDTGGVCVWPKEKQVFKDGFFFSDKKITSNQYEYFMPFDIGTQEANKRWKKRKCTCAQFAPESAITAYNNRR